MKSKSVIAISSQTKRLITTFNQTRFFLVAVQLSFFTTQVAAKNDRKTEGYQAGHLVISQSYPPI